MISQLRGTLLYKLLHSLIVDVAGVGYECEVSLYTLEQLPEIGQNVTLLTHLIVREDAHLLYAFSSAQERAFFREFIKISGVGPKLALAILSSATVEELVRWVHDKDIAQLKRIPGIGTKTAERLLLEMRDRLQKMEIPLQFTPQETSAAGPASRNRNAIQDAIHALITLGYKSSWAHKIVTELDDGGQSCEQLIRLALQREVV